MSKLTSLLKSHTQRFLRKRGIVVTRTARFDRLLDGERYEHYLAVLAEVGAEYSPVLLSLASHARSQFGQDLVALAETGIKRGGYFVEVGAASGVNLSNTYFLEKDFGWSGVVAEPARIWSESLRQNRACSIEQRCVWSRSGERLRFNEVSVAEFSTIRSFNGADGYKAVRETGLEYEVETVSLADLLDTHGAPSAIDYLSIDTEGSEFEILSAFPFDRYSFKVISCEHNFTENRERIYKLLTKHGYKRKYAKVSQVDDWYVKE